MAYRMLGSAMEAEDIVQEAYLRYRATPSESIRTLKSFLTTIVHHLCIDHPPPLDFWSRGGGLR